MQILCDSINQMEEVLRLENLLNNIYKLSTEVEKFKIIVVSLKPEARK